MSEPRFRPWPTTATPRGRAVAVEHVAILRELGADEALIKAVSPAPASPAGGWCNTWTGKKFYPLEPDPKLQGEVVLEDIAHALANLCRYNGHCLFYSVAEHSVRLSRAFAHDPRAAKYALLHDASEAYLSDLPRPLKKLPEFAFYREIEDRLQRRIYREFGLDPDKVPTEVLEMDRDVIGVEARARIPNRHADWKLPGDVNVASPTGWVPEQAKAIFLTRFSRIFWSPGCDF